MNKTNVFITGGSGFIGSNLIKEFSGDDQYQLLNADIVRPREDGQLRFWRHVDILNGQSLKTAVIEFQPDFVIHLAARTDLLGANAEDYLVNTKGTRNLIDACRNVSSVRKIIFSSSMLVCRVGHIPNHETEFSADTAYGLSKVEMENIIRHEQQPWQWTIVRPTSIWGPGFKEPYRNFFDIVRQGKFLDIGRKYCTKTYGFVGNTIYQITQILAHPDTQGKVYYLGDEPPIFISQWGREIALESNRTAPKKIPYWLLKMAAVTGDIFTTIGMRLPMTSFRLKNMTTDNILDLKELYYIAPSPPYSRSEGIKRTIEWLNNQESNR